MKADDRPAAREREANCAMREGSRSGFSLWTRALLLLIAAAPPLLLIGVDAADVHFISSSRQPRGVLFSEWINKTQQKSGMFINHTAFIEGEVLLFKAKKTRYRAIPVMGNADGAQLSKFNDAITFKEWLVRVYAQEKAVKVSVRTTDVVRPVMLHLHASKDRFLAPIIIHADVFDSDTSHERAVDPAIFIDTAKKLLPEAIISLGWTPSIDSSVVNKLDWTQTFRLVEYIHDLQQPLILNMGLNDAVHSAEQLEWLLGIEKPAIYLVVRGQMTDFVDQWQPLSSLTALAAGNKLLFDVDDTWRIRLGHVSAVKKGKRSVEPEQWRNVAFPNPFAMLSTSIISTNGVAFLGWPNSLLLSTRRNTPFSTAQRISGRVLFLTKRQVRDITPAKRSGLVINLFDSDPERLTSPNLPRAIRVFIGYDGRVTIENREPPSSRKQRRRTSNSSTLQRSYHESASGQLPQWPCYGFDLVDRGWRVEVEIWSEKCEEAGSSRDDGGDPKPPAYHTFLQLDTPPSTTRKTRNVAIGKTGDGAIDFLVQELRHSAAARPALLLLPVVLLLLLLGLSI